MVEISKIGDIIDIVSIVFSVIFNVMKWKTNFDDCSRLYCSSIYSSISSQEYIRMLTHQITLLVY